MSIAPRAVAHAAGLAAEPRLERLDGVEQRQRLERRLDEQAGVQEARLVEHLADGVGVVGRRSWRAPRRRPRQRVDGAPAGARGARRRSSRGPAGPRAGLAARRPSRSRAGRREPRRLDLLAHRLRERQQPGDRAQHHGEVGDQPVLVEAQQVEALDLPPVDRRPGRSARAARRAPRARRCSGSPRRSARRSRAAARRSRARRTGGRWRGCGRRCPRRAARAPRRCPRSRRPRGRRWLRSCAGSLPVRFAPHLDRDLLDAAARSAARAWPPSPTRPRARSRRAAARRSCCTAARASGASAAGRSARRAGRPRRSRPCPRSSR